MEQPAIEPLCEHEHEDCKSTSRPKIEHACDKLKGHRGKHRCGNCKKEYSQGRGKKRRQTD